MTGYDDTDQPSRPPNGLKPLESMSIDELEDYIARLNAEIGRARAAIEAKTAHAQAAMSFFKIPK